MIRRRREKAEGFGKSLPVVLRALVEAGLVSRQAGDVTDPGHLPASGAGRSAMIRRRREKVFGPGRAVPLDRSAKARILAYARAWGARHKQPRQHKGPITRAFLEVLEALLWGFHNSRTGCCFPSYAAIAARAECARSTVAEALKALEWAGVLTWQNRITRIHVRERDLFGHWASRWRVIRTSNAEGLDAALTRKHSPNSARKRIFDGVGEAKLIALACSPPPKGRKRWTLTLLETAVVQLNIVDRASDNTIGRTLKKTLSSLTYRSNGSSHRRPTPPS